MSDEITEFEKESRDPMIRKLASLLEEDLKRRGEVFCIQNEPLAGDEVSSHNGLLPLFCYKAAVLCEEAMQKKLPLYFEHDRNALIETVPMTESGPNNLFSLWVLFLHYAVEEEINRLKKAKKLLNGQIPLDDLYQKWHNAIRESKYTIRPSSKPVPVATTTR